MPLLLLFLLFSAIFGSAQSAKRIIGGSPAEPHDFPFFAAIFFKHPGAYNYGYRCGGTIISANMVVTSAMCVTYEYGLGAFYKIQAGVHKRELILPFPEGNNIQTREKDQIYVQNCYKAYRSHDLAVIQIKGSWDFNQYVQPIDVPDYTTSDEISDKLTVVGFGFTYDGSKQYDHEKYIYPPVLQKVEVPLISKEECQKIYDVLYKWGTAMQSLELSIGQFCASENPTKGKAKGVCTGDYGGGLYGKKDGRWVLQGVVSFYVTNSGAKGISCMDLNKYVPDVHTQISRYSCWLQDPRVKWSPCDHNKFGSQCQVTHPTTIPTTKPTTTPPAQHGSGVTATMSTQLTTEDPDFDYSTTDDNELITIAGNLHLMSWTILFAMLAFLSIYT